jgi:hypothetical protein
MQAIAVSHKQIGTTRKEEFELLTQEDVTLPNQLQKSSSTAQITNGVDHTCVMVGSALIYDPESPESLDSNEKSSHDLLAISSSSASTKTPQTLSLLVGTDDDEEEKIGFSNDDVYIVENGSPAAASTWSVKNHSSNSKRATKHDSSRFSEVSLSLFPWNSSGGGLCGGSGEGDGATTDNQSLLPMSPRKLRMQEREAAYQRFYFVISSPVPYLIFVILLAMIVMIFVDVIAISGLVCITAVLMTITLVCGNLWRGREVWGEGHVTSTEKKRVIIDNKLRHNELTYEDRLDSTNEFLDSLFNSIDYSLLLIFLGLFVVVANLESTGIPKQLW